VGKNSKGSETILTREVIEANNRYVMLSFLPRNYTVTQLLQLVEPKKSTLIIEAFITESGIGIIGFYDPEGAVSVLNQFPDGHVYIRVRDPYLGEIYGSVTIKPAPEKYNAALPNTVKLNIEKKGATRVLKVTIGKKQTKDGKQWMEQDYKKLLGSEIENVSITSKDPVSLSYTFYNVVLINLG